MHATPDTYRPFFNRRIAPVIRQILMDRDRLVNQVSGVPLHHFAKPQLPTVVRLSHFPRRHFGDSSTSFSVSSRVV